MNRETILKHSKSIRLKHTLLPDFIDLYQIFVKEKNILNIYKV